MKARTALQLDAEASRTDESRVEAEQRRKVACLMRVACMGMQRLRDADESVQRQSRGDECVLESAHALNAEASRCRRESCRGRTEAWSCVLIKNIGKASGGCSRTSEIDR